MDVPQLAFLAYNDLNHLANMLLLLGQCYGQQLEAVAGGAGEGGGASATASRPAPDDAPHGATPADMPHAVHMHACASWGAAGLCGQRLPCLVHLIAAAKQI